MAITTYDTPVLNIQVFDNTVLKEEVEISDERKEFNGMQVGFFAGGRDNQLLYMPNSEAAHKEFGDPDFRKYGQAAYNAFNVLDTDQAGMYIMNLRPATATHANIVIMVRFKLVEEDVKPSEEEAGTIQLDEPGKKTKKLVYSFYPKTITGAKTNTELLNAVIDLMDGEQDEQGYYNMPFFMLYAQGRGTFGNDIHVMFSNVTDYTLVEEINNIIDDVVRPKYHLYRMTISDATKEGLVAREVVYGNFDQEGYDKDFRYGPATFFSDTINVPGWGSQKIYSEVYSATLEAICKLYNETFDVKEEVTPGTLDLLTHLTLDGTNDSNLELDTNAKDYINLFALDGITLESGNDGWDGKSAEEIKEMKKQLLISAYAGDIDPNIRSRFYTPCDFNLDANYDIDVKRQMAELANKRQYDCMTYLDLGIVSTVSGMVNVAQLMYNVRGYNVVRDGHWYNYRDAEYTGKICQFTITHWLGKQLALHMASPEKGLRQTMAVDNAVLRSGDDYIPGQFYPKIDPDNKDVKDTFYKLRVNCYEIISYDSVQRATPITTCKENSDRLIEMNEYILHREVKLVYNLLSAKRWKLGESSDRSAFATTCTNVIDTELGAYLRNVSVTIEMTPVDEQRSLLRIKLSNTFKTIIKSGEIQIYLEPRVSNESITTAVTTTDDGLY